jgi:translation initiation factor IF-3
MRIVYSEHARQNMLERKIHERLVAGALSFPDKIILSRKGRKIAHKKFGNRLLRVVYKETDKVYIIVTVYFSRSDRYNESQV